MPPTLRKRKAEQLPTKPAVRKTKASTKDGPTGEPPRGKRLLPAVVDHLAKTAPDTVFASIPRTSQPSDGFEEITYARLANAVNRTATLLYSQLDIYLQPRATIAYLGPSDIRYVALILAAQKIGCWMFLPAPHNPVEAQKELLEATETCALWCSKDFATEDQVTALQRHVAVLPEVGELFDVEPAEAGFRDWGYEKEKSWPFVILHTSGTTGTPKPVRLPHTYYAYEDLSQGDAYAGSITSVPFSPGTRCLTLAPMWHAGGIFFGLLKPILNQVVTVLPPAGLPITAELVDSCLKHGKVGIMQAAPSLLADMTADLRYQPALSKLKYIIMGSGPMSKDAGDKLLGINANTLHFFGATETDLLPLMPLDDPATDWQYHHFHPLSGATFRKVSQDVFELVIKKVPSAIQPYFSSNFKSKEFATKDVFSPHPTKPDLWKFDCRLDDIITFSTGEKMNPTAFEKAAAGPGTTVLVVGQGRPQPALLVWMVKNPIETWLDWTWPKIEAANALLPTYGRIDRDMVALVHRPDVTPKGTVNRKKTEIKHAELLDKLYAARAASASTVTLKTTDTQSEVQDFIQALHTDVVGVEFAADADIFAKGPMDSMKAAQMVRSINKGLAASMDPDVKAITVTPGLLYARRTPAEMAKSLHEDIKTNRRKRQQHDHDHSGPEHEHHYCSSLLERHVHKLPRSGKQMRKVDTALYTFDSVLLTGSTGTLGSHILHKLLRDDKVKLVDCLNRSPTASEQFLESFPNDEDLLLKARFHHTTNLNAPHLGLDSATYGSLIANTTTIIHNAWPVHFHLPLQSHEGHDHDHANNDCMETLDSHIGGLSSLITFAASGAKHPQLVFISSMSAVIRHSDPTTGLIPETIINDPSAAEANGYAQSKWAGEQILQFAITSGAIRKARIIRPGQIAGPLPESSVVKNSPGGIWDPKQAIPSLIMSSKLIKTLPDSLGEKENTRWIPVNLCARIIMELSSEPQRKAEPSLSVYNITNKPDAPGETEKTWNTDMLPIVKSYFEQIDAIGIVTLKEWIERVEQYGPREDNVAFKLLDFYEGLVEGDGRKGLGGEIETTKARGKSQTLRRLEPIREEWMRSWLEGWGL